MTFKIRTFGVTLFLAASLSFTAPVFAETFTIRSEDVFEYPNFREFSVIDVRENDEVRRNDAFSRLPRTHAAAIELLYRGDLGRAGKLIERVDDDLFRSNDSEAAKRIGAAFYEHYRGSRIVLGELSRTLQPLAGSVDEFAGFLSHFLKGYPGNEVLLFSTTGLDRYSTYSLGQPFLWEEASLDTREVEMLDRVFVAEEVAVIPFFDTERFQVELWGNDAQNARGEYASVRLWKIEAERVSEREWPGGKWYRNVLVLGNKTK